MHSWAAGVLFLLFSGTLLGAEEHVACQQPRAYQDYGVEALFTIANSCKVDRVADLFYNRAYHLRQVEKYFQFESSLNSQGSRDSTAYIHAYRIHIGLAEALLSKKLTPDSIQALDRLNRIYERSGEIAELRFRGYDLLANKAASTQGKDQHLIHPDRSAA
jgi:hypothetical protein